MDLVRAAEDGFTFRDLNKNGRLDPYEDPRRPFEERADDLLSQMTLEEKAGLMFHSIASVNPNGSLDPPAEGLVRTPIADSLTGKLLSHVNCMHCPSRASPLSGTTASKSLRSAPALASPSRSRPTRATRSRTTPELATCVIRCTKTDQLRKHAANQ